MRKYLLAKSLFATLTLAAAAAPLSISQLTAGARDSLQVLQAKGMIEGYPDGTLKGEAL